MFIRDECLTSSGVSLMSIFAFAVGYATFIENDYGTITAKSDIFNASLHFSFRKNWRLNVLLLLLQLELVLILLFIVDFLAVLIADIFYVI